VRLADSDVPSDQPIRATDYVRLRVVDDGVGIAPEVRAHLFEPFFTTKEESRGTGMGLAAVYGTVKNHRGMIAIASTLGRGTTVRICLPLTRAEVDQPGAPPPATAPAMASMRVMLVDDEDLVRDIMARLLRQLGCDVVSFGNGFDAVEHYRATWREVDLVVLDMVMPLLDGKGTYYALRRINPQVRVILASGYSIDGEAQALLDEGVAAFLQKPFRLATLADAIACASDAARLVGWAVGDARDARHTRDARHARDD
jgi:CheY-like chemotaxis protein